MEALEWRRTNVPVRTMHEHFAALFDFYAGIVARQPQPA